MDSPTKEAPRTNMATARGENLEWTKAKSPPTKKIAAPSTNARSETILGIDFPEKYPVG